MSNPQYIVDANTENYAQRVLENSRHGPVLVNYWSPRAGPCLKLWPILQNLANEYCGRFLLVNVNTDAQSKLAKQQGINSVPTVKLIINEQIVTQVHGAESEKSYRTLLEKHIRPAINSDIAQAILHYKQGNTTLGYNLLKQGIQQDPENLALPLTLIKLYMHATLYQEVNNVYEALPYSVQQKNEFITLKIHCHFLALSKKTQDKATLEKNLVQDKYNPILLEQLCALALIEDNYESAINYLLNILQNNFEYCDKIAQKGLITIFQLLGQQHSLTQQYRTKMSFILENTIINEH